LRRRFGDYRCDCGARKWVGCDVIGSGLGHADLAWFVVYAWQFSRAVSGVCAAGLAYEAAFGDYGRSEKCLKPCGKKQAYLSPM